MEPRTHDLRVGVIGLGARSRITTYAHRPGRGSAVVALADPNPARLASRITHVDPGVRRYLDYREMLATEELDAVFVLTPDDLHFPVGMDSLAAGAATFLDKPMSIRTEDCDSLLEAARSLRSRLYIGHNMRHMPVVTAMRDIIEQGIIGEVKAVWCRHFVGHGGDLFFKDWMSERDRVNGLLVQKGAHDIDLIHWLSGGITNRVVGMGRLAVYGDVLARQSTYEPPTLRSEDLSNWPPTAQTNLNPKLDVEDLSMAMFQLDNGVLASYEQCNFTPDYWRNYTVIGDRGRLENFGDVYGASVRVWNRRHDYAAVPDLEVSVSGKIGDHGGADPLLVEEFLSFAANGGLTRTSPVMARHAVAAAEHATRSLRSGSVPVDVPGLDPELQRYFDDGQPGSLTGHVR